MTHVFFIEQGTNGTVLHGTIDLTRIISQDYRDELLFFAERDT